MHVRTFSNAMRSLPRNDLFGNTRQALLNFFSNVTVHYLNNEVQSLFHFGGNFFVMSLTR